MRGVVFGATAGEQRNYLEDDALDSSFNMEVVFLKDSRREQWRKLRVDSCFDPGAVRNPWCRKRLSRFEVKSLEAECQKFVDDLRQPILFQSKSGYPSVDVRYSTHSLTVSLAIECS